jgi:hypothetical protein
VPESLHFPGPNFLPIWLKKNLEIVGEIAENHASHNFKNFQNAYNNNQTQAFMYP